MKVISMLVKSERRTLLFRNSADQFYSSSNCKVKVKLSCYRPEQVFGVPGGSGSRISKQSAHEGGKAVSPTHRPSLTPRRLLALISVKGWVDSRDTMRPEGLSHWKISVTPSGIESATFRLVAQCLNQLRHRVPPSSHRAFLKQYNFIYQ
jgi:hypothetical protein